MNARAASQPILIVDDDVDVREAFGEILADEGYAVELAGNGAEAIQKLDAGLVPGLFLVDMMMPVMDGATFCAAWKQLPSVRHVPLYLVSASAVTKAHSAACGATGFLPKPVGFDELLQLVRKHLGPPG